ncbi:SDR family oxidoreductase [Ancylomarina salipaludis]|uniref:SDR family oxidoreductase n=1 Tax=Ancylomarina salipaludis TaxID=2501299 RepID=A0A4Q1JJI9_9BACT|nr:SDR family oxidoreductase [Ancylomarina salipaludis]RXQ91501.1 SDR family oxidoreductase [Ancylomarina salipaludis]
MKKSSQILITGATGKLGKEVLEQLLTRTDKSNIVVMVREQSQTDFFTEKGIEVRLGNYDNIDSLSAAFAGIDKLYFVSGNDINARTQQHENVVKAAKDAQVKHVVYTSFMRKNNTDSSPIAELLKSHILTEEWLQESGMDYTILKHNTYADMLPVFLGEKVIESGRIFFPAGDGKVAFVTRKDMAELASVILTSDEYKNKIYEITNTQALSFKEIASFLSELIGKDIRYVSPSKEEYTRSLSDAGVPEHYIGMFAAFAETFKQGELDETNTVFQSITGHKPLTVTEFLTHIYNK